MLFAFVRGEKAILGEPFCDPPAVAGQVCVFAAASLGVYLNAEAPLSYVGAAKWAVFQRVSWAASKPPLLFLSSNAP